ncbi:MAG: hypothetical protein FWC41_05150 [Firmicutes bacterium]|nr:hypothetical protein [Bacillota bacterium]
MNEKISIKNFKKKYIKLELIEIIEDTLSLGYIGKFKCKCGNTVVMTIKEAKKYGHCGCEKEKLSIKEYINRIKKQ